MLRTSYLLLAVIPALSAAAPAWGATGTIHGTVAAPGGDPGGAVVYIAKIADKTFPPPERPVVLDQVGMAFVPHVLPVLIGTTVAFPNNDEVPHDVFSPSPAKLFNVGSYPPGATRTVTFDKPGEVALLCNIHPEMSAFILVVETPYFAVADREGKFEIRDVPAGSYTLRVWHEKYKGGSVAVTVTEGKVVTVTPRLKQ